MFVGKLLWFCLFAVFYVGSQAYDADEVTFLPGMTFKPPYKQWSGYLQTRPGRFFHYWWEFITLRLAFLYKLLLCKMMPICVKYNVSAQSCEFIFVNLLLFLLSES